MEQLWGAGWPEGEGEGDHHQMGQGEREQPALVPSECEKGEGRLCHMVGHATISIDSS